MEKKSLAALLERGGPGTILLLGSADYFTEEEIERALKKRGFETTREFRPGAIVAAIESRRIPPAQELESEAAYKAGVPHYSMEELERLLSDALSERQVLMSLKLSRDRDRLVRLLRNEHLSDEFFLDLLRLYSWESDELMGSDEDRYVLIALLERFLDLSVYERDALYSPSTLLRLIVTTQNPELLDVLLTLPEFEFRRKGAERVSIAQAVAQRDILRPQTVAKLLSRREEEIDRRLAANAALDAEGRRTLFERAEPRTLEALAKHPDLEEEYFDVLLGSSKSVRDALLRFQPIDTGRLGKVLAHNFDEETLALLGENERLASEVYPHLLTLESDGLLRNLAANDATPPSILERLASRESLHPQLALNPASPEVLLWRLYEEGVPKVLEALAYNPSTPVELLERIYTLDDFALHQGLAANPSTPMEILHQLKTDHRLWLVLQRNEKFVKEANREMGMR